MSDLACGFLVFAPALLIGAGWVWAVFIASGRK